MSHLTVRGRTALGDTSLVGAAVLDPMIARADVYAKTLSAQWTPTGFYTPGQVTAIASQLSLVQRQILAPLNSYIRTVESGWTKLAAASIGIIGGLAQPTSFAARTAAALANGAVTPILPYVRTAGEAQEKGIPYLDAPGFRRAVLEAYVKLINAARAMRGIQAGENWIGGIVLTVGGAFQSAWSVIMTIVGVVEKLVTIALKVPDAMAMLSKIGFIAAVVVGGLYLYEVGHEYKKRVTS